MKANAPEKLYVDVHDNLSDSILYGFTEKRTDEDIEYICTDAFIEKACEFIKNKANLYLYHCISEECDLVDTDKMIEDLKNYIKGE